MSAAVGYLRVSTQDQADEGVSLDSQLERIRAYCLLNNHSLDAVYRDAGLSGKRVDNRPGLNDALNHVCREQGILVVYSLSRMSRSVRDTIEIAERLTSSDANLSSITEAFDTSTATGRMVFKLLAVFAEFEREILGERPAPLSSTRPATANGSDGTPSSGTSWSLVKQVPTTPSTQSGCDRGKGTA